VRDEGVGAGVGLRVRAHLAEGGQRVAVHQRRLDRHGLLRSRPSWCRCHGCGLRTTRRCCCCGSDRAGERCRRHQTAAGAAQGMKARHLSAALTASGPLCSIAHLSARWPTRCSGGGDAGVPARLGAGHRTGTLRTQYSCGRYQLHDHSVVAPLHSKPGPHTSAFPLHRLSTGPGLAGDERGHVVTPPLRSNSQQHRGLR
jgi:hypothetical protein